MEFADLVENRPPAALRDDPSRAKGFNFKPTPLKVLLSGTGITGSDTGDAGPETPPGTASFYSCGCRGGDPRGGWPIALAILVTVRRRRGSSSAR